MERSIILYIAMSLDGYIARKNGAANCKVEFISEDIAGNIKNLKKQDGKDIWIVGGAKLIL